MRKVLLITFSLIFCDHLFGQKDILYKTHNNSTWLDTCKKNIRHYIQKQTDFKFDKHPLEQAQIQLDSNLLKTDTLYDTELKRITVSYYNKSHSLFLVKTTSTELNNWTKKLRVFDNGGNLIFSENYSDTGGLLFRLRRGYYGYKTEFECYYYDTPLYRFRVFSKKDKVLRPDLQVCDCDF